MKKETLNFHDTSSLLVRWDKTQPVYVSSIVLEELEHIKLSATKDPEVKAKARKLVRDLIRNPEQWTNFIYDRPFLNRLRKLNYLEEKNDHWLICEALALSKHYAVNFYTADGCLYLTVKKDFPILNAIYVEDRDPTPRPKGFKKVEPTAEQWQKLHDIANHENIFDCAVNEYVRFEENGEEKLIRWNGEEYVELGYLPLKTNFAGTLKPLNVEQQIAFDLLQNPELKIISLIGQQGSGKTYVSLAHGLAGVMTGEYQRLYYLRNNVNVADVPDVGALPGSLVEKLYNYLLPVADCLGSRMLLDDMLDQGLIEPLYLGDLKGRNLDNCFLLCDESEDLTIPHSGLIIGRVGKGTKLCFCGDLRQTDLKACQTKGSGLDNLNKKLFGRPLFGMVELQQTERSEACEYANYL